MRSLVRRGPRRRLGPVVVLVVALLDAGCAHRQLTVSTVLTANTHQQILFQMVLDNVAMFASQPDTLPWHIRVRDGTVQVQDQVGIGQQGGGFSTFSNGAFGIQTYGPQGARKVALQWGTDAVGDPVQLFALQTVYRRLLGLPPLPVPNFIAVAARSRGGGPPGGDADSDGTRNDNDMETRGGLNPTGAALWGEVPRGWFHVGRKHDVPKHASYVAHHDGVYVWVMPDGVGGLTRFTLLVLSIVKLTPTSDTGGGQSGLMFTPSG